MVGSTVHPNSLLNEGSVEVPNAKSARVDVSKVIDYLLSDTHPAGQSKARFFMSLGFSRDHPQELIVALLDIVHTEEVRDQRATPHGRVFVVDGIVRGKIRAGGVRTVWLVEEGHDAPRLVTAYPNVEIKK
jgi:hypothetical protein